ncbi:MAG: type II toxin-antitoxin system death-on-curing family toxin [Burkholderiales bacterium]|nr:type II toxin-antitoxin system death-on-curing family toxin [Burkholderiales bacterium]
MIVWLEKAAVLAIHDRQIAEHGGSTGVRDEGLLESALARPQQRYAYGEPAPDLAELAATLAYGLARNHPFVDGNKRTAAVCCEAFLELNGAVLEADDLELYPQYLALAEGRLTEAEFAAWLRSRLKRLPRSAAHEPRARYGASRRAGQRIRSRARAPA